VYFPLSRKTISNCGSLELGSDWFIQLQLGGKYFWRRVYDCSPLCVYTGGISWSLLPILLVEKMLQPLQFWQFWQPMRSMFLQQRQLWFWRQLLLRAEL
jgi:hypothetical protein